jgi:putative redox protein
LSTKTAVVKLLEGMTFVGKTETEHWVVMDTSKQGGGSGASVNPKELVLLGLAGCTSMDVVSILRKKRSPFRAYEIHVRAEMAEDPPRPYTAIHLEYVLFGEGIKPSDVEHAIALSEEKYCGVSAMLRPTVPITHSYRIEP